MTADRPHLASLDVLRGLTIAAMILVNNPGDWNTVFPTLVHADWNGLTFADVVFPFFVFIMGCAMPFAFARRDALTAGEWRWGARVLRRSVTLVGLGLLLNLLAAVPAVSHVRVPGVLQRLGVAYLIAAVIVRSLSLLWQTVVALALLVGHWALMASVVPCSHALASLTRAHNLAGYVDTRVFGSHLLTPGFDPEGLLGTAPTAATALGGALTGAWLRRHADLRRGLVGLILGGSAAVTVAWIWSAVWPFNKPLWTGSYALLCCGLAALMFALCAYVVDVRGISRWARPFHALGVNPLAIYFGSELTGHLIERPLMPAVLGAASPKDWVYWHGIVPLCGRAAGEWSSLLFAIAFVGVWTGLALVLDRHNIRIRV
jgi:predicted acyltransferase